jgi:general stress protein YciG
MKGDLMETTKRKKGFAAISPERQRAIASAGGRAAHRSGRAHEFTSEEAKIAGKKGGNVLGADREHMRVIGRCGGAANARRLAAKW